MAELPNDQLLEGIGFGLSKDGRLIELQFRRKNGTVARVHCGFDDLATIFLRLGQVSEKAWELQREAAGGRDPRELNPLRANGVSKFQGATTKQGRPLLSVVLENGIRLELSLPPDAIPDLVEWLGQLQEGQEKGSQTH